LSLATKNNLVDSSNGIIFSRSEGKMKKLIILTQSVLLFVLTLLLYLETTHSETKNFVVRGILVCLGSKLHEPPCKTQCTRLAIREAAGRLFPLTEGKSSNILVQERKLQTNKFQLILKQLGTDNTFEIIRSQLIRGGKVYDFFYFCEICNITTYIPGPCMCCRAPTQYHETQVK